MKDWQYIKNENGLNTEVLKKLPEDRDFEILFDNGNILKYSDENYPFAEIIAWREITTKEIFVEGRVLAENEYLLKIRPDGSTRWSKYDTGFLTKLNKNGSIPVNFTKWNYFDNRQQVNLDIYVVTETYRSGWKIVSARFGESQNWAVLLHPDNYTVEIYMDSLIDLIKSNTIINGEIQGEFKWKEKKLEKKD